MNQLKGFIINDISLPFNASVKEAFSVADNRLRKAGIMASDKILSVYRRSIDARKKNDIRFVYSVLASFPNAIAYKERYRSLGIVPLTLSSPEITFGDARLESDIVIVGAGPCGLFCALLLAEHGFKPVIIEQGGTVEERKAAVKRFDSTSILDPFTNIQFGAGGAGTFSDGKLITRINDPLSSYVLEKLVEFGAPEDILTNAKPHVGTDVLSAVICNIIKRIEQLGGRVMYHTEFLDMIENSGRITSAVTSNGAIECSELVLAIGHSSRKTYSKLIAKSLGIEAKSFSVGMRIEHSCEIIDKGMFGDNAGNPLLGHAEYSLSHNTKERGVYTFCMCPGGVVVAATSEDHGVVSNGMSYHARDGKNSNSAVCCSVFKEDYGATPESAIEFQRNIERAAYRAGGNNYYAPIITVRDFLNDSLKYSPTTIQPTYMSGVGVKLARAEEYLPRFITDSLRNGILAFDKKINGFATGEAVLTGAETRTSSPVRILRDRDSGLANGYTNLYPSGEGAGYAGGITSAAIDGLKTALRIMSKYRCPRD